MRVRWRGLELPSRVVRDPSVSTETYGKFTVEPFERGFGTTVGNSLRRILLSSLEGAAVSSIRIKGADHEFSSLPGVMEDVTDIVLNVKSLIVKSESDEPVTLTVAAHKAGEVKASAISASNDVTIVNGDHVLATLTEDVDFEMSLTVETGRGYRSAGADVEESDEVELGIIAVDSVFSPVTRVRYGTEDARVGQKTDYDRLVLEVWTNGTVSPEMAVVEAAKILRKHLNPFVQYFELGTDVATEEATAGLREAARPMVDPELEQKLNLTVQELDLSVRANNCLESAKIGSVRDLVERPESELLKVRSFGKTSLREVKRRLADMGLSLGMDLDSLQSAGAMESYSSDDDDEDEESDEDPAELGSAGGVEEDVEEEAASS